jgi:hypothetical protein
LRQFTPVFSIGGSRQLTPVFSIGGSRQLTPVLSKPQRLYTSIGGWHQLVPRTVRVNVSQKLKKTACKTKSM